MNIAQDVYILMQKVDIELFAFLKAFEERASLCFTVIIMYYCGGYGTEV